MATRTPSFYTGNLNGNAGSLITALEAILVTGEGWTKPYTGTNGAHFRQPGGNSFQLFVNDNATGAGLGREAIVRGAEAATAYATLTDPFPTVALVPDAACVWRKGATADGTNRPYWAVADDRFLVMVVRFDTNAFDCYYFGDIEPYWTGDNYHTVLNTRNAANSNTAGLAMAGVSPALNSSAASNVWFARTPSGGAKVDRGCILTSTTTFGNTGGTSAEYPHPQTSKLHQKITEIRTNGTTGADPSGAASLMRRGTIPFLMDCMHGVNLVGPVPFDTFTDTAYGASSQFILFQETSSTTMVLATDRFILQTAGTWDPGY